jgi:hypothetical protein
MGHFLWDGPYQPFLGQWGDGFARRATLVTYNISNNALRIHEENGSSNATDFVVPISTDEWHLINVVRGTSGNSRVYLDAALLGTVDNRVTIHDASSSFFIGKDPNDPQSFGGLIDDVRIYDSALSESEIQAIFSEVVPEPASIAVWGLLLLAATLYRRRRSAPSVSS